MGLAAALALSACGSGGGDDDDVCMTNCGDADGGAGTPDADLDELVWTPLITGEWTLAPGTENTSDVHQVTLDRDIYVGAIRPIEPLGTHHTVLGSDSSTAGILYASGVGTNAVVFPEGVGLKFPAGATLSLQLHVYNVSDQTLAGTSGVEIVEVDPGAITQEADLFLPGPLAFALPDGQESTVTGTCTLQQNATLFALFPHMHQLGTHFKTTIIKGGEEIVLHDAPYDFNEQAFTRFDPIELSAGDQVKTTCTWFNNLGDTVTWGESSNEEMCFSILYRYPVGSNEICTN